MTHIPLTQSRWSHIILYLSLKLATETSLLYLIFVWKNSGKLPRETTLCYKDGSMREQSKSFPSFHRLPPRAAHCSLSTGGHTTQLSVNYPPQPDLVAGEHNSVNDVLNERSEELPSAFLVKMDATTVPCMCRNILSCWRHLTTLEENPLISVITLKASPFFESYAAWMPLRAVCFIRKVEKMLMDIYQFEKAKPTAWEWI